MARLYHITTSAEAEAASRSGTYEPRGFVAEGFIHCSYARQLLGVANLRFRGQPDLVLLEIDPERIESPIVLENLEGGSELFPHLYGRLPFDAVCELHPFPPGDAGEFSLPPGVQPEAPTWGDGPS